MVGKVAAALLAVMLVGCTADELKNGASSTLKGWCRSASNCTVQGEAPR